MSVFQGDNAAGFAQEGVIHRQNRDAVAKRKPALELLQRIGLIV